MCGGVVEAEEGVEITVATIGGVEEVSADLLGWKGDVVAEGVGHGASGVVDAESTDGGKVDYFVYVSDAVVGEGEGSLVDKSGCDQGVVFE